MERVISRVFVWVVERWDGHASLLSRAGTRLVRRRVHCWDQVILACHSQLLGDPRRYIVALRVVRVAFPCIWIRVLSAQGALRAYRLSLLDLPPTIYLMAFLWNLSHLKLRSRSYLELVIEMAYSQSTKRNLVLQAREMLVQSLKLVPSGFEACHAKLQ